MRDTGGIELKAFKYADKTLTKQFQIQSSGTERLLNIPNAKTSQLNKLYKALRHELYCS